MTITAYYDFAKLYSFNATFNGVCGGRGLGKTYGSKRKSLKDATRSIKIESVDYHVKTQSGKDKIKSVLEVNKNIKQFIYLRRYKEELAMAKATFFADIEHEFPGFDFRVMGWEAQASPRKYASMERGRPWATIGFFVALSVAQNYKSVQFPNVMTIIFDEFIIEKGGQYLQEEARKLMNFYNTVDRYQGRTRVLMLANSVSITNPYFIHYRVEPQKADDNGFIFIKKKATDKTFMLFHFPESSEFESEVYQTEFGKFMMEFDPDYVDYAVHNQFKDNHEGLVDGKPYTAKYFMTLETKTGVFSIWYDNKDGMFYCQEKRIPRNEEDFVTLVPQWMEEGKRLGSFTDKTLGSLRTAFRHDRMRFDRAPTRNAFMEIFKR